MPLRWATRDRMLAPVPSPEGGTRHADPFRDAAATIGQDAGVGRKARRRLAGTRHRRRRGQGRGRGGDRDGRGRLRHDPAFVLAFARGLQVYIPQQLRREWKKPPQNTGIVHLPEATALVVGVGGIGSEITRLAAQFGLRVLGVDERRTEAPPGMAALHRADEFDALLPQADFVILTVPHTPETEGFMNRARFQAMKTSAFFINIGRGRTTRLDDLAGALQAGEIAGAGLDVFEEEPLPADHPLWTMPGVLLTPHVAGYGPHLDERRFAIILDNCRRFLAGQELRNRVDKARWY
jgi:phosphoglycerate dehydrogenase-like enzyme